MSKQITLSNDYVPHLQRVLEGEEGGVYIGGTLSTGGAHFEVNGSIWSDDQRRTMTDHEKLLVCKIYVNNKTPGHAFYSECKKFINDNEGEE